MSIGRLSRHPPYRLPQGGAIYMNPVSAAGTRIISMSNFSDNWDPVVQAVEVTSWRCPLGKYAPREVNFSGDFSGLSPRLVDHLALRLPHAEY